MNDRPRKPSALRIYWNKDLSISIYCHHRKVHHVRFSAYDDPRLHADDFCAGWFGTDDKTQWKTKWYYR